MVYERRGVLSKEGEIMGYNKVICEGNLGRDSELRNVGDTTVLSFSVGANESWKDKSGKKQERCEWFSCSLWGPRAEALSQFLTKGKRVLVEGKLRTDKVEGNDGVTKYFTKVRVDEIVLLGGGEREEQEEDLPAPRKQNGKAAPPARTPPRSQARSRKIDDADDLPF